MEYLKLSRTYGGFSVTKPKEKWRRGGNVDLTGGLMCKGYILVKYELEGRLVRYVRSVISSEIALENAHGERNCLRRLF